MPTTQSPVLVTLGFDRPTFERLNRLRSRYYPPERNIVPAHLCLFHQLPGEEGRSIDRALHEVAHRSEPIPLRFPSIRKTSGGMMAPVDAPALLPIRASLARDFARWLTPQDCQPFQPHVTIMNKADRTEAELAFQEVAAGWSPWTGVGDRLLLWRYLGGPWDLVELYRLKSA